MWFKQAQLFQLESKTSINAHELEKQLERLSYTPCLPHLPVSQGWISPTDEEDILVYSTQNTFQNILLICLQIEEKLLPMTIVGQKVNERIKEIESIEARKISNKERKFLKHEMYNKLLPQAFGKQNRIYAFINIKNNWLIINTNNQKKTEKFAAFFKRSTGNKINSLKMKKLSPILTDWLLNSNLPKTCNIEDACVFQDPNKQSRIIRIQNQDLSANGIQSLLKDGFEISQLKLTWNDQVTFTLKNDFTLQSIQYQDRLLEPTTTNESNNTKADHFDTDFVLMSGILMQVLENLVDLLKE